MSMQDEMREHEKAQEFEKYLRTARGVFATFEKEKNGITTNIRINATGQEVEGLIMSLVKVTVEREKAECAKDGDTCDDPHTVISYLAQLGAKIIMQETLGGGKR